ncbi:hypothetical protein IWX90DRAFT_381969 [Phyllosticta citrichinensis]|uniref:Uncharacterized protein n=1 Tax=Phyllosticta citrichinensis TaxID=1130410 RepID=A0ABR1XYB4_9PEZI
MSRAGAPIFNALIRTHHITSRKKVANLKKAASKHDVYALLRSGGCPGIMYCEGMEDGVNNWVGAVQRLRYKDFHLVTRPAPVQPEQEDVSKSAHRTVPTGLFEVETVKEFSDVMDQRGVLRWWKRGMGYVKDD